MGKKEWVNAHGEEMDVEKYDTDRMCKECNKYGGMEIKFSGSHGNNPFLFSFLLPIKQPEFIISFPIQSFLTHPKQV